MMQLPEIVPVMASGLARFDAVRAELIINRTAEARKRRADNRPSILLNTSVAFPVAMVW